MVYAAGPGVVGLREAARPLSGKQVTAFLGAVNLTCTTRSSALRMEHPPVRSLPTWLLSCG